MVQIRWIEHVTGVSYGHLFKGSPRVGWVRFFDQPLHRGTLPARLTASNDDPNRILSWHCDYGTWYFWYAVGEMLGRTAAEKVAYTRFIFKGNAGSWSSPGFAQVDTGLKRAAKAYDAIRPYREGLYDLYPQFVAQYLNVDKFYQHLDVVELEVPGYFKTTSNLSEPLQPLATQAWRFRIHVPETSSLPHAVRFTLDALPGTDREDLHLIVGNVLVGRPVSPKTPYTGLVLTKLAQRADDGAVEYLVRVANVAKDVSQMGPAGFSLRVEVDGHYGEGSLSDSEIDAITGALPPGFGVGGPGTWSCAGGAEARAVFDLRTPDETAGEMQRMVPEMFQGLKHAMENGAIGLKYLKQSGRMPPGLLEKMRAATEKAEAIMKRQRPMLDRMSDEAAAESRTKQMTPLGATFVGTKGCQMRMALT